MLSVGTGPTVELFAGPGGWGTGAQILGRTLDADGLEVSADAVATATAAGHRRRLVDVTAVDRARYAPATGLVASPPCPTFSASGLRTGRGTDYQNVLDIWTGIGWGIDPDEAMSTLVVQDKRTALLALAGVWAMTLPNLEWLVMEQVPAVEFAWEDLAAELYAQDWASVDVLRLQATDYGVPSRRERVFLLASRYGFLGSVHPAGELAPKSMAEALGWGPGEQVNTRGNRRTSGGNVFAADRPAWCLTGKARGWYRVSDGARLTAAEAGLLNTFPADYPWAGSRSSQFQQVADVVAPAVAARVLGAVWGVSDAARRVEEYLADLYAVPASRALQLVG